MPPPERGAGASRPRVLVTGAGGPAAVAFLRAVDDADVELFAADIDAYAAGLYLVPAGRRVLLPRGDADGFDRALLSACIAERIDIVVPTVDAELLPVARARKRFEASGIRAILASIETLAMSLDKWRLANVCRDTVLVPETMLVDDAFDGTPFDGTFVVKPRTGSGSRGVRIVERPADLDGVARDGTMIAQEYLPGEEYSLDVLALADGHVVAVVPRVRLKVDSGVSVAGRTVRDPELEAFGLRVAERIGLTTVANVQCRRDVLGRPSLLEVNPRFSGAMPLTVASGVNMPLLALSDALGRPVPAAVPFREIAMVRFLDDRFPTIEEMGRLEDIATHGDAQPHTAVGTAL
jgi:carbamoyl-phosphate synthase large subunit